MGQKGIFITVEGMDGSGKTSVCQAIARHFERLYPQMVILTREPGGNGVEVCEQIRSLVLSGKQSRMSAKTEALLFAASRAEHIDKLIAPSIAANKLLICDRFVDSSIAYQGIGRGLGADWVSSLNRMVVGELMPDLTILLVLKSAQGASRLQSRPDAQVNHLDLLPAEFHEKVGQHFLKLANDEPERFFAIDASATLSEVIGQAVAAIDRLITDRK